MKRLIAIALFILLGTAAFAQAPVATSVQANLTLTNYVTCSASAPCSVNIYRWTGACPATGAPSGTSTVFAVPAPNPTAYVDTTFAPGGTYCYVAQTVSATGRLSGPSNYLTLTDSGAVGPPGSLGGTVTTITTVTTVKVGP